VVNKKKLPGLTANLIHRIAAVTSYRNDSSHARSLRERTKRDREIRTRLESAADLLYDLVTVYTQLG
jgi:hypothetical protein